MKMEELGQADGGCSSLRTAKPARITSHGRYPVAKLVEGQTIRFRSKNYGCETLLTIRNLRRFGQIVMIAGDHVNDVAFDLRDYVELVTVEEADGSAG